MVETQQAAADTVVWNVTDFASKPTVLRVLRQEAARFFALAGVPEHWQAPTACAAWQVRDTVGHMVDVTEGYLERFALARSGGDAPAPLGLRVMAQLLDERARSFRSVPQADLLARLRDGYAKVMALFEGLSADDWMGLSVPHPYMGPLPAFIYPVFQIVDYSVHSWDIYEGLGRPHALAADAADLLVPIAFAYWQATTATERLGQDETVRLGFRVAGRNASSWRVTVSKEGYAYEPGAVDDLPCVLEFDPASLFLTSCGRIRGGALHGDPAVAERYGGLFFGI